MIIVTQKKKLVPELKIKFSQFSHSFDNAYSQIFPANTPGCYKSPLGQPRAKRWVKRLKQKDRMYALMMSLMTGPFTYALSLDPSSIIGWMMTIWAYSGIIFLFLDQRSDSEEKDERIHRLELRDKEKDVKISKLFEHLKLS